MSDRVSSVPSEIEAKLLVPHASDARAIAQVEQLGTHRLRPRDTVRLRSIYIDTAEFTLARGAVALRLRDTGSGWEATAKWAGRIDGVVHQRSELTVVLPHAPRSPFLLPEGPLRMHLGALVAGRPLAPILIADVHRRRFDVLGPDQSQPVAELALDEVSLRAPGERKEALHYCETEVELLHGTPADVATLARLLQHRFDLLPSTDSKFARGLALLYGAELSARRAPGLRAYDTLAEATRKVIALHLGRLRQHDPGTRLGEDPEALHDMRVASRRLRAAVRAFEAGMPKRLQTHLTRELRWLGQVLGSVRDLDVQLASLGRYGETAPPGHQPGLAQLREHLQRERAARRTEMLGTLDSGRYFRLLVQLERFTLGRVADRRPFNEPIAQVGRRALKRAFRRVLKRGAQVSKAPTDEGLHSLRIRVKRVRYLLEFLRDLIGKPGRHLVKRTTRLQDLLGSHHDATVAAQFIHDYVHGAGAQSTPAVVLALGACAGAQLRQAEEARGDFQKAWRRFSRARTLKDLEGVLDRLRDQEAAGVTPDLDGAQRVS
jgi:triphosphatase